MYDLIIKSGVDKIFMKLSKKDPAHLIIVYKKIIEIRTNPYHKYKFLRKPLQNYNRVHIDSHFVLLFRVHHDLQSIELFYYGHHDTVYEWRP